MENNQYRRAEGKNDAERARMPESVLEEKLYSPADKYFAHDKLNYGGAK
ncbi:MAG: hypothetical protein WCI72_03745 [archaeon]